MEIVGRFILRFILVPLGGIVAMTVAMLVMLAANWAALRTLAHAPPDAQESWLLALVFSGPVLAFLLSLSFAFSLMAAAVGVLMSETFAIRSWIFHAANGGLAAWIGWALPPGVGGRYRFFSRAKNMNAAG